VRLSHKTKVMPKKKIIRKRRAKKRVKKILKPAKTPELNIEIAAGIGYEAPLGRNAWLIRRSRKSGKK
jgi:hypothetical protein